MPERIQLRRIKGWRKPEGAIVVARPSKWGNPWKATFETNHDMPFSRGAVITNAETGSILGHVRRSEAAKWAVAGFRMDLTDEFIEAARTALRGRDLACWCPLNQDCHADVLLEIANQEVSI